MAADIGWIEYDRLKQSEQSRGGSDVELRDMTHQMDTINAHIFLARIAESTWSAQFDKRLSQMACVAAVADCHLAHRQFDGGCACLAELSRISINRLEGSE